MTTTALDDRVRDSATWDTAAPVVSVVCSTRNHATYLGDLLAAVADQDVDVAFELVLVDNASTDHTDEIVEAFVGDTTLPMRAVRGRRDRGAAGGRNRALDFARGEFVAFTDSDCVPTRRWLRAALDAFSDAGIGVVQGRTRCTTDSPPFLSHFIETPRFDQSFSTSNVVYRRAALGEHRFDADCIYWEDTDLGFRVTRDGWAVVFEPNATVAHQVVPQSARQWVLWPTHYENWPAKAARYPQFRDTLFARLWVRPIHAWFDLAVVGVVAALYRRASLVMAAPYVVAFARSRGLRGKAPLAKVGLYLARDAVATVSLIRGSIHNRTVVL